MLAQSLPSTQGASSTRGGGGGKCPSFLTSSSCSGSCCCVLQCRRGDGSSFSSGSLYIYIYIFFPFLFQFFFPGFCLSQQNLAFLSFKVTNLGPKDVGFAQLVALSQCMETDLGGLAAWLPLQDYLSSPILATSYHSLYFLYSLL